MGGLTLLSTACSSSAQARSRVLRTTSRCCVAWSSAWSSRRASSCAAFTRVPATQSVISWQTAGRILERFLKTSSRQPNAGRLSRLKRSRTGDGTQDETSATRVEVIMVCSFLKAHLQASPRPQRLKATLKADRRPWTPNLLRLFTAVSR